MKKITLQLKEIANNLNFNSFQGRVFLLLLFASFSTILAFGSFMMKNIENRLYDQIGHHALIQAKQIAAIPNLVESVEKRDLVAIDRLMNSIRKTTDAVFITIGDKDEIRLYHVDPQQIGSLMIGGDNSAALKDGHSYISIRQGTLGYSLRAKSPIINQEQQIIGVVSVGYTLEAIETRLSLHRWTLLVPVTVVLIILMICAWLFSMYIKRKMLNIEPFQLARLIKQQEVLFESLYEGVIAIDLQGRVTAINHTARKLLSLVQPSYLLIGEDIRHLIHPNTFFFDNELQNKKDEITLFNNITVIANRMSINIGNQVQGWVISFKIKDDISTLNLELRQIQQYTDNLRAMRHEQMNKLSTVAGLLHIKAYDAALKMITQESEKHQNMLDHISNTFENKHIAGLLIGKYYRAQELGLKLVFDPYCEQKRLPIQLSTNQWISIIGNLLDNAYIASLKNPNSTREVLFYLNSQGKELSLEISDNGCGIPDEIRNHIFKQGITSQTSGDHGIGLYLVYSYVTQAKGSIIINDNSPCGTIFSIFIPYGEQNT